jgi:hypothetical protein
LRIETGICGDKISDIKNDDIIIEVQRTNFPSFWNKQLHHVIEQKYKNYRVGKKALKKLVEEDIQSLRKIFRLRRN